MDKSSFEFLRGLLETPGPSGSEGPVQELFQDYVKPYADEISRMPHGSVAAVRNPGGAPRLVVVGHADEVGLVIHHIDDNGFLYVRTIGGLDPLTLVGATMEVHTATGMICGVIGRKPIHLQRGDDKYKLEKIADVYIDIGARSKKEAERRVRTGDPVTFRRGVVRLGKEFVSSKAMDNRTGVFAAAETLRRLGRAKPKACVIALSSVVEEIGADGALTAAYGLRPDVAIAVDVSFAVDQPDVTDREACDIQLAKGPSLLRGPMLNEAVVRLLEGAAKKAKIPVQYETIGGRTGTDGDMFYRARRGIPIGVVGVPCRYMHTPVEVVALRDLDSISKLLSVFARDLTPATSLAPFTRGSASR